MRIKIKKADETTHHLGTFALPSEHAISVHVRGDVWIYSEPIAELKPEDRAFFEKEIAPTLEAELKKKRGENRHKVRRMKVLLKRTGI